MRTLCLLLLCGAAAGGAVDEILFRARHAQLVQGDYPAAITLYRKALEDRALDAASQARVHYRIAICYDHLKDYQRALDPHLTPHLYAHAAVPPELRRLADAARSNIKGKLPKVTEVVKPRRDEEALARERFAEALRQARRFLESGDEMLALVHTQRALKLDPDDPEARALDAELERRLSGVSDFIRDPLRFVRKWTDTRITQVAKQAQEHLTRGVAYAEKKEFNLAWAAFRSAVELVDGCEFAHDSDRLMELRHRIVARWDSAHRSAFGKPLDEEEFEAPEARSTVLGEFMNGLQSMLDLVSDKDREYRIVPIQISRVRPNRGWKAKPESYRLFRDVPSTWSPAEFARLYLPLRVNPDSWGQRDNYIEAIGGMIVARNRPEVLDVLLDEVARLERPRPRATEGRFVLVPASREVMDRMEAGFGRFAVSHRGPDPLLFRIVPGRGLEHICSQLRDFGSEVQPSADMFAVDLANGVPQTFFMAKPLTAAAGYEEFRGKGMRAVETHFGLIVDLYPLQDRMGRTTAGLRVSSRLPASPLNKTTPRFMKQEGEVFVDMPSGASLIVGGLLDPFSGGEKEMLLLWQPGAAPRADAAPEEGSPVGAEVPLRNLLLKQRDFPGPRADASRGFVDRDRLEALSGRARWLEAFLRRELESDELTVHVEEGVARMPSALREDAVQIVGAMERESTRSYIIEVHTRAVRSSVLARWLERAGMRLAKMEGADVALVEAPGGEFLLESLDPTEPPDVFAPQREWHKPTALGLQARHLLSTRTRTSPVYESEDDLATGGTRTISEGLRITVRPYTWTGNRLRVDVEIDTAALERDEEERALPLAVPSRRTLFSGSSVRGTLDLGHPDASKTALLCRIPHPTRSRADRLTELVVVISVRRVP